MTNIDKFINHVVHNLFPLNEYSEGEIRTLMAKFKQEAEDLEVNITDDQLKAYIERLDQIKNSSDDPIFNINDRLNGLENNLNINTLSGITNQIAPLSNNNLGNYKGFTFFTREENDPKFNVRGNKRHYVVAVDTKNIERIKSDFSFTLNPTQLVTQLKLVIDQQNLQG